MDAPPDPGTQHDGSDSAVPENETPATVLKAYSLVVGFLQAYGWFVIFGVIALAFVYYKLEPYFKKQKERWDNAQEYRNYDPEQTRQRQEDLERARLRLQEQHNAKSERFSEEQKKKDEAKRKEKIEDWERHQQGRGYRSKVKTPEDDTPAQSQSKAKKQVYKNTDYSPLTGGGHGGGGASYRPARRGGGGG